MHPRWGPPQSSPFALWCDTIDRRGSKSLPKHQAALIAKAALDALDKLKPRKPWSTPNPNAMRLRNRGRGLAYLTVYFPLGREQWVCRAWLNRRGLTGALLDFPTLGQLGFRHGRRWIFYKDRDNRKPRRTPPT